ncbi:hypothetical protein [Clostridium saccharoperbutylacetonicum]
MIILVSDNGAIQISVKQIKKVQAMENINNYILISPKDEPIGVIDLKNYYLQFIFKTDENKFYFVKRKA